VLAGEISGIGENVKKAVLFTPFWGQPNHVGNNRIDRFLRWLTEAGYRVIIIRAGSQDAEMEVLWGQEITVVDRLGFHPESAAGQTKVLPRRKPNRFRRALACWLFNPDPVVVWAKAAARHPKVLQAVTGATFILSSSPPESAHLGAWRLSRRLGVPHIVDMRDGWLDEPLKPLLRNSAVRRWQEGCMEARILQDAAAVQVTSDVWQDLLCQRLPELSPKVKVLTNGYPQHMPKSGEATRTGEKDGLLLIHAGRFLGSRLTQSPDLLLQPLLDTVKQQSSCGTIQLIGPLSAEELAIIERFKASFAENDWEIDCPGNLPRQELLQRLPQADGLLLLSASYAAIPSKVFEYIPTCKPIFVVTEKNSATWRVCEELPHAYLVNTEEKKNVPVTQNFLAAAKLEAPVSELPHSYSEIYLSKVMLEVVNSIL
jgi:hypothetical protein